MADKQPETPVVEAELTATEDGVVAPVAVPRKKKKSRKVPAGQVHVKATFNNTIISITDTKGAVLASSSAGSNGFRGSKKGTAYAAQVAADKAIATAKQDYGLEKADVFVKGIGMGRDAAIRTMITHKVNVETVYDVTGMPHGGVRPKKARRT